MLSSWRTWSAKIVRHWSEKNFHQRLSSWCQIIHGRNAREWSTWSEWTWTIIGPVRSKWPKWPWDEIGPGTTLTNNIIINGLTCCTTNYLGRMTFFKVISLRWQMIWKFEMVRTKDFNKNIDLLILYLHYYYSLRFLRIKGKDRKSERVVIM